MKRDKRRSTLQELKELVERAKEVQAKECQAWHLRIKKRCMLSADHPGLHRWRYNSWSKIWKWNDD